MTDTLRLLVVGPHSDDCSIKAGGIAAKYVEADHEESKQSRRDRLHLNPDGAFDGRG